MYKTREIRWFFKENNVAIEKWFAAHGKEFSTSQHRTDFYLPIAKEDIGIKLRGGNIEIKQRHAQHVLHHLAKNATGYLEDWVKWGFGLNKKDALANSIIKEGKYDWIAAHKQRIGVKALADAARAISIHDIKEELPAGCQIEYTRLMISKQEYFTFGCECFGDDYVMPDQKFFESMLENTTLKADDSMGYSAFLNKMLLH
jgi:hypothetical protein